ncbi:peptidase, S54 (rhomboid) family [Verrucomicrobiia bacterium DG1235]|nr:peptidase, S54 (rhomboid) family [Verrucomicrobiae bacterium DG1235]
MLNLFALHYPQNDKFQIWQFVSHMFMHGSPTHILFNMFGVYTFGIHLERMWGTKRFLIFYFISGIGAATIYTGINIYEFGNYYSYLTTNGVSIDKIQSLLDSSTPQSSFLYLLKAEEQWDFLSLYHSPMVGASGALYGILVAFAMLFPTAKLYLLFLPMPIAAKYLVPALLLFDLFSGVTGFSLFGGGIAHFAHIGGAVIGFSLMTYWRKTLPRRYYQ